MEEEDYDRTIDHSKLRQINLQDEEEDEDDESVDNSDIQEATNNIITAENDVEIKAIKESNQVQQQ